MSAATDKRSLTVTVLGSSGLYETPTRACSGYLVQSDGVCLLVDAGPGVWRNLRQHVEPQALTGVVVTHQHYDHTTDLFQLGHALRWGGSRKTPLPLWGPQDAIEMIAAFSPSMDGAFEFMPLEGGDRMEHRGVQATVVEMVHSCPTLGVRFEARDGPVSYSADSGAAADFAALAAGAQLLICEASLQDCDELWAMHLTARQAGTIARRCQAARLVLTHLPVRHDIDRTLCEASETAGDIDVLLAEDHLRLGPFAVA